MVFLDADEGMFRRQEHAVVQLVEDCPQRITQGNEIDHVIVFIQRSMHFGRYAVVVPVQPFARVCCQANEMRGAEGQVVFRNSDVEVLHDRGQGPGIRD